MSELDVVIVVYTFGLALLGAGVVYLGSRLAGKSPRNRRIELGFWITLASAVALIFGAAQIGEVFLKDIQVLYRLTGDISRTGVHEFIDNLPRAPWCAAVMVLVFWARRTILVSERGRMRSEENSAQ